MRKISMVFAAMIAAVLLSSCSSAKKTDASKSAGVAPSTNTATQTPTASSASVKVTAKETETSLLQCSKAKEVRMLQVASKDKGCELNYTKDGKSTTAASSTHNLNHCVKSEKKIQSKLEKAGFTCEVKG